MTNTVQNYRNMVEQPWGRMFYELIYRQLNLPDDRRLKILDFGAGFCLTADHYAKHHAVTAVEPNEEMAALRVKENDYTLVPQGAEYLAGLESAGGGSEGRQAGGKKEGGKGSIHGGGTKKERRAVGAPPGRTQRMNRMVALGRSR